MSKKYVYLFSAKATGPCVSFWAAKAQTWLR